MASDMATQRGIGVRATLPVAFGKYLCSSCTTRECGKAMIEAGRTLIASIEVKGD